MQFFDSGSDGRLSSIRGKNKENNQLSYILMEIENESNGMPLEKIVNDLDLSVNHRSRSGES